MSTRPTRKPRYAPGYMILPQQRDAIVMPVHIALTAFEHGAGSLAHYYAIASFLNISNALARRMKTAPITSCLIERGMTALLAADTRFTKTGQWGFSGPEMLAVRESVTAGDELSKRANTSIFMAVTMAVGEMMEVPA